ncbi:MAG: hypothetical protein AAGE52_30455 [Myxococcota bacterium]
MLERPGSVPSDAVWQPDRERWESVSSDGETTRFYPNGELASRGREDAQKPVGSWVYFRCSDSDADDALFEDYGDDVWSVRELYWRGGYFPAHCFDKGGKLVSGEGNVAPERPPYVHPGAAFTWKGWAYGWTNADEEPDGAWSLWTDTEHQETYYDGGNPRFVRTTHLSDGKVVSEAVSGAQSLRVRPNSCFTRDIRDGRVMQASFRVGDQLAWSALRPSLHSSLTLTFYLDGETPFASGPVTDGTEPGEVRASGEWTFNVGSSVTRSISGNHAFALDTDLLPERAARLFIALGDDESQDAYTPTDDEDAVDFVAVRQALNAARSPHAFVQRVACAEVDEWVAEYADATGTLDSPFVLWVVRSLVASHNAPSLELVYKLSNVLDQWSAELSPEVAAALEAEQPRLRDAAQTDLTLARSLRIHEAQHASADEALALLDHPDIQLRLGVAFELAVRFKSDAPREVLAVFEDALSRLSEVESQPWHLERMQPSCRILIQSALAHLRSPEAKAHSGTVAALLHDVPLADLERAFLPVLILTLDPPSFALAPAYRDVLRSLSELECLREGASFVNVTRHLQRMNLPTTAKGLEVLLTTLADSDDADAHLQRMLRGS